MYVAGASACNKKKAYLDETLILKRGTPRFSEEDSHEFRIHSVNNDFQTYAKPFFYDLHALSEVHGSTRRGGLPHGEYR
jgi:hypothetical protein